MKQLKNIHDLLFSIKTMSPFQYSNELCTDENFREMGGYEGVIVNSDDILDFNQKYLIHFSEEDVTMIGMLFPPPSYFNLTKRTKGIIRNFKILNKQFLKYMGYFNRDTAGSDELWRN